MSVSHDGAYGDYATLQYWRSPAQPDTDPPTMTDSGEPVTVTASDSHIDAAVPVVDSFGLSAGVATVSADLAPNGPQEGGFSSHNGNHYIQDSSTYQGVMVSSGTLSLPDGAIFDLTGCVGSVQHIDVFATNPDAFAFTQQAIFVNCYVSADDYYFELAGSSDGSGGFAEVYFSTAGQNLFGEGSVTLTDTTFSGVVDLGDPYGNPTGTTATIDATATSERVNLTQRFSSSDFEKRIGLLLHLTGTITISTDPATVIDASLCNAIDSREVDVFASPSGPRPGTRLAANDVPSGATTLVPSKTINTLTRNTSADPEAPCDIENPDGSSYEPPWGHTLWYKTVATGNSLTVDTTGSDFDTVAAVYTSDGTAFTELACVDDVPIVPTEPIPQLIQAKLTVPTVPGTIYYVQVGGYTGYSIGSFGRLKLVLT